MLPEDIKKKVHELTDHLKDPREKINVLYDFLQKNTHYISIQLGIGGWQPFPADYVAAKRYGDCKALSNYMIAWSNDPMIPKSTIGISICILITIILSHETLYGRTLETI